MRSINSALISKSVIPFLSQMSVQITARNGWQKQAGNCPMRRVISFISRGRQRLLQIISAWWFIELVALTVRYELPDTDANQQRWLLTKPITLLPHRLEIAEGEKLMRSLTPNNSVRKPWWHSQSRRMQNIWKNPTEW